jgi:hypothetical protein
MRRLGVACLLAIGLSATAAPTRAQISGGLGSDDPFFLYYGWYLPRQAAMAVTPRPEMTVNAMAAIRQQNVQQERAGLYDPVQPFGAAAFDPSRPFANRTARTYGSGGVASAGVANNGLGPPRYYQRASSYFPGLRPGRGVNASSAIGGRTAGARGAMLGRPY